MNPRELAPPAPEAASDLLSGDPQPPDSELAAASRSGDRRAFAALYDRHAPHVYTLARRVLGSDAEAEAIVSDVFVEFWRKPDRWDPSRGVLRTYLLVLARSRAIDRARSAARRVSVEGVVARERRGGGADPAPGPPAALVREERSRLLRGAVDALTANQREPLRMAFFDGLTHAEIAERLGQPLGTIKTRIRAAMAVLRSKLESNGGADDGLS